MTTTIKAPDRKYKLERVLNSRLPDHIKERVRPGSRHAMNHPTFLNYAYTMLKQLEDRDKPHPLPEGQYDIILVDPPWKLDADTCEEGRILEMLPQIPIAAKNSIMFMWATSPKYLAAIKVMTVWGFKYTTGSTWIRNDNAPIPIDDGFLKQPIFESLLFGKKGKGIGAPYPAYRHSSVFKESEGENRESVYEWIERTHPNHTYLELFARSSEPRKWWTRIIR